jgi:hypothetical protein
MKGFRRKIALLLIVYFAGFATAIYVLAPGDKDASASGDSSLFSFGAPGHSDSANLSTGTGEESGDKKLQYKKWVGFAEDAAGKVSSVMKDKIAAFNSRD